MKGVLIRKTVCILLCALFALSLAACGGKTENAAVDLREKLAALTVSTDTLGITGKYTAIADIPDCSVDPDLVGTWLMPNRDISYTFTEDGMLTVIMEDSDNSSVPFTCTTINGFKILCQEVIVSAEFNDNVTEDTTQLSYTAYDVENDALYQVNVEEPTDENINNFQTSLVMLYRTDESGSAAASVSKNPIAVTSVDGSWTSDKGDITIENGTLKLGEDSFTLSFDEKNQLVVEKDGQSTTYLMTIISDKSYDVEDRSKVTESTSLALSFTGADENDKPNLLSVLDDWKADYDWDSWYYTGNFTLQN